MDENNKKLGYSPDIDYEEDYSTDYNSFLYNYESDEDVFNNMLSYDDDYMNDIQNNIDNLVLLIPGMPVQLQTIINKVFKPILLDWRNGFKDNKYPNRIPDPDKPIIIPSGDSGNNPDPWLPGHYPPGKLPPEIKDPTDGNDDDNDDDSGDDGNNGDNGDDGNDDNNGDDGNNGNDNNGDDSDDDNNGDNGGDDDGNDGNGDNGDNNNDDDSDNDDDNDNNNDDGDDDSNNDDDDDNNNSDDDSDDDSDNSDGNNDDNGDNNNDNDDYDDYDDEEENDDIIDYDDDDDIGTGGAKKFKYVTYDKMEIFKLEYVKNVAELYNYYTTELNKIVGSYYGQIVSVYTGLDLTPEGLDFLNNAITLEEASIASNLRCVMDNALRNEVAYNLRASFSLSMFSVESTLYHLKNIKTVQALRLRYEEQIKEENTTKTETIANRILRGTKDMYDAKYDNAYINLYKYLNSSLLVLDDIMRTFITYLKSKEIILKKGGLNK